MRSRLSCDRRPDVWSKRVQQAVMTAPRTIEFREAPEPTPGPGEVRLRIQRIGVCGSDVHVFHGRHPYVVFPVIQGHEFCGTIDAIGADVQGLRRGMKATALPQVTCGRCDACRRGDEHICDELRVQGFQSPGCAQPWFVVRSKNVVPLPDDFTFEQGAMVEPTAVAVHAVNRAGNLAGNRVAVLGAGPIGNLVAQVARARGAQVIVSDLSEHRLRVAADCGLADAFQPSRESLADAARRVFGDSRIDVAFECVGVESTLRSAVEGVSKGGAVVVVGVFADEPTINVGLIQDRELRIYGSLMYQRADYLAAVDLIASGKVRTQPLESAHFPLTEYRAAYDFIDSAQGRAMKVFIDCA